MPERSTVESVGGIGRDFRLSTLLDRSCRGKRKAPCGRSGTAPSMAPRPVGTVRGAATLTFEVLESASVRICLSAQGKTGNPFAPAASLRRICLVRPGKTDSAAFKQSESPCLRRPLEAFGVHRFAACRNRSYRDRSYRPTPDVFRKYTDGVRSGCASLSVIRKRRPPADTSAPDTSAPADRHPVQFSRDRQCHSQLARNASSSLGFG